jgi:dihydrofolate synthase/folylpolyglutamate synthase
MDGPGRAPDDAPRAYKAAIDRLYALSRSGTRFGLDRIGRVLEALGHPERGRPAIHVAGSNGKGSTSAFAASILSARGPVGLYTSPHLISLTERVQIVSRSIPEEIGKEEFVAAIEIVEAVAPGFADLSFFEVVTAAGLVALARSGLHANVIEAGLGARLDATRLVDAQVAVLTDLSLEHTDILGATIEEIAREEGAVVRSGRPLVMADGPPAAMRVVDRMAADARAIVHRIGADLRLERIGSRRFHFDLGDRRLENVEISLLGPHQGRNAILAAKAATLLDPSLDDAAIRSGLLRARWPGRMEVFDGDPPVLLDGAHNPHGAEVLAAGIAGEPRFAGRPIHLVFGVLADKDVGSMIGTLGPIAASIVVTRPGSPRARPASEVAAAFRDQGYEATPAESVEASVEAAKDRARRDEGWVVVCGSLYLVGDARALLLQTQP